MQRTAKEVMETIMKELGFLPFCSNEGTPEQTKTAVLFFWQWLRSDGSFSTARGLKDGLVTLDINEYVPMDRTAQLSHQVTQNIEERLCQAMSPEKKIGKWLPAVRRGEKVDCYYPYMDNRFMEYDFEECLFDVHSKFQHVQIFTSPQFGSTLIIDEIIMIAESDVAYTRAITGLDREKYAGRTVLVLGGGDGGVLHELLRENPAHITMVDLDMTVIEGARRFLRGVCGDSLDNLQGANYQVLVEDCVPVLERCIEEGKTFDYVINDLTDIPVTNETNGDLWDSIKQILELSMQVLAPDGVYYTQGNSVSMPEALATYEAILSSLSCPVSFSKETVCVPSYHEMWVFYRIWKTA